MRRKFKFKKFANKYVFTKRHRLLRLKNHPFVVPVVTLLTLSFITMVLFIAFSGHTLAPDNSHIVILSHDKRQESIPTKASNVGDLLKRLDITLNAGDVVEPSKETPIVEDNFRVNVYRAKPVTIIDGGKESFAFSAATTPQSISRQAGITVYPEDKVTLKIPDKILKNNSIGQQLIIERAKPVYLVLYGVPISIRTHAKNVEELIKEKAILLDTSDKVQPAQNTAIKSGMFVVISRKGTNFSITTEEITSPIKVIEDSSLSFGTEAVRQQGRPGKAITVYQTVKVNRKNTRKKIQRIIAEQPIEKIIARGKAIYIPKDISSIMSAAGVASSDYPYVNYIISREGGWCPTKMQGQVGYCPAYAPDVVPYGIGYGICQATPGTKMQTAGADWKTSSVTQLRWCSGYASKYGGWAGAYQFWLSHGWW